ncbi:MAG: hypothetical protein GXO90_04180 [FCB group bacterium]|nr:hypothetical protein [FCB group bacterium]
MSTTILETAETLEPGHMSVGIDGGWGIDLTSSEFISDDDTSGVNDHLLYAHTVSGFKIGVGITDNIEIDVKSWLGGLNNAGMKLYWKQRISSVDDSTHIAILPGISHITSGSEKDSSPAAFHTPDISAIGFNIPVIISRRYSDKFSLYGAGRYSINRVRITRGSELMIDETYWINRLGMLAGFSFDPGHFYFQFEMGMEGAKRFGDGYGIAPILGIGFGLKL